jgi:hypothetical protein
MMDALSYFRDGHACHEARHGICDEGGLTFSATIHQQRLWVFCVKTKLVVTETAKNNLEWMASSLDLPGARKMFAFPHCQESAGRRF